MEALEFTTFLTLETLKTFAGQVLAVVIFTQLLKEIKREWFEAYLRHVALAVALWIQGVMLYSNGGFGLLSISLAVLNGTIIALVAMKGAEMVKGGKDGT